MLTLISEKAFNQKTEWSMGAATPLQNGTCGDASVNSLPLKSSGKEIDAE